MKRFICMLLILVNIINYGCQESYNNTVNNMIYKTEKLADIKLFASDNLKFGINYPFNSLLIPLKENEPEPVIEATVVPVIWDTNIITTIINTEVIASSVISIKNTAAYVSNFIITNNIIINDIAADIPTEIKEDTVIEITEVSTENIQVEETTEIETSEISYPTYILPTQEEILNKIAELKVIYPHGMYWNYGSVTNTPCDHKNSGYGTCNIHKGITNTVFTKYSVIGTQCLGFASLCSDYIYGNDVPAHAFYNFDEISIGDQIRTNNDSHSVFVIEKGIDYVVVGEVNADYQTCKIEWGRVISRSELEQLHSWYIKRY